MRKTKKYFDNIKSLAMERKPLGFSISGAGPSMFALCENNLQAEDICEACSLFLKEKNIDHHCFVSKINLEGAIKC